ncbi:MAG: hypothetical protein PHR28_02415 [candidate division Zixibacteria bacterium]|nr:hypothetical protein [candidate division Zixibacteria bacterium]
MRHRQAPLSARNLIVSTIVVAAAVMVILLLGFHHHHDRSEDAHCLICLVLSMPVLLVVAFLFRFAPGRVRSRTSDDRPVLVSEYAVPFHLLRAPPVSL